MLLAAAYFTWSEHGWQDTTFVSAEGGASRFSETFVAPQSGQQTHGTVECQRQSPGGDVVESRVLELVDGLEDAAE